MILRNPIIAAALVSAALLGQSRPAAAQRTPAAMCTGQDDCSAGVFVCKAPGDSGALHGRITLDDRGHSIRSDGKGAYAEAAGSNVLETATHGAVVLKLAPDTAPVVRSYFVDLDHPVPGGHGQRRGIIKETGKDGQAWIAAQWRADSAHVMTVPRQMTIGSTVKASAITVTVHVGGSPFTLQLGPLPDFHCFTGTNRIHGRHTSTGTITRTARDTWIVDVPRGSAARLFDIRNGAANAVDLGLYYVSMHLTLVTDRVTFRR
jgi:hypothetical protein